MQTTQPPTNPEWAQLSEAQDLALDMFHEVIAQERRHGSLVGLMDRPEVRNALLDYNQLVEAMEKMLGPAAHCLYVDPRVFYRYSYLYETQNGAPASSQVVVTRQQCRQFIDANFPRVREELRL